MNPFKLVGVLLVVVGVLGAAYGGFSYTKATHAANIGPLHLEVVEKERVKRGLLNDLPKELLADVDKYYRQAVDNGVFDKAGGSPQAVKLDFDFYTQAGQMAGPAAELKVEEVWDFGPLERARKKMGG